MRRGSWPIKVRCSRYVEVRAVQVFRELRRPYKRILDWWWYEKTDQLFRNEAGRVAFKKLVKFERISPAEISMSALIHFDATVTDAVDSLRIITVSSSGGIDILLCNEELSCLRQNMRQVIPSRVGTLPQDILQSLKLILLVAWYIHLFEFYETYKSSCAPSTKKEIVELSVCSGATIGERLNDESREGVRFVSRWSIMDTITSL